MMNRTILLTVALASLSNGAIAQRNPVPDPAAARIAIEQAMRERSMRTEQEQQRRRHSARENCIANRGVDCDSPQGLAEWLQLERTRSEAVLDRIAAPEPAGSASTGSSAR